MLENMQIVGWLSSNSLLTVAYKNNRTGKYVFFCRFLYIKMLFHFRSTAVLQEFCTLLSNPPVIRANPYILKSTNKTPRKQTRHLHHFERSAPNTINCTVFSQPCVILCVVAFECPEVDEGKQLESSTVKLKWQSELWNLGRKRTIQTL